MQNMTVTDLLEAYKNWVEKGDILFVNTGGDRGKVLKCLEELLIEMRKEKNADFSWYEAHQKATALWQKLASLALHDIAPDSKGNSRLFDFLEAATEFEDLLYGLELHYRDHTVHSLWVYLIGEHILRNEFPEIHGDLNWYLFNDIKKEQAKYQYPEELVEYSVNVKQAGLLEEVQAKRDAIWCIMALCHDLGYSLEKLPRLNEKVKKVLSFFEVAEFRHIGYSLDVEHQYLVSQFLELMAMDVRIVPGEDYEELKSLQGDPEDEDYENKLEEKTLIKCYRDDSTYWILCRALEKKQHGVLSSYLIYKTLGIFADAYVQPPAEKWGLDDESAIANLVRGDILFAIAQHEFDFAYLDDFGSLADLLILADELEEFSRYGRELQGREYHPTVAHSRVGLTPSCQGDQKCIEIDIVYEVTKERNLIDFFLLKTQRLCRMYSLREGKDNRDKRKGKDNEDKSDFYRIEAIRMTAKRDGKELILRLERHPDKTRGILPKTRDVPRVDLKEGYRLECRDDEVYHIPVDGKEISLVDWFRELDDEAWNDEKRDFLRLRGLEAMD